MCVASLLFNGEHTLLGLNLTDVAILVARLLLGVFFVLARFRFFYDPAGGASLPRLAMPNHIENRKWFNPRRAYSLTTKLVHCGCTVKPSLQAWIAATVEVLAGLGLIVGLLTVPSAIALLIVLLVATRCTAKDKVCEQNPCDKLDVVCAYLWRVEGLYIGLAAIILLAGPGAYSIDHLIWR